MNRNRKNWKKKLGEFLLEISGFRKISKALRNLSPEEESENLVGTSTEVQEVEKSYEEQEKEKQQNLLLEVEAFCNRRNKEIERQNNLLSQVEKLSRERNKEVQKKQCKNYCL